MVQHNNQTSLTSHTLKSKEEETFTHNGSTVKIITVFNDDREITALIEDENGEISQVPRDSIS